MWDAVGIFLESGLRPGTYISWSVDETMERLHLESLYGDDDDNLCLPLCLTDITVMFSNSPVQE